MTPTDDRGQRHSTYDARSAAEIEQRWQARWQAEGTFRAPNPVGDLLGDAELLARPKKFVLDMFPYPSGSGLHVGHPLGYIATDVHARFLRMTGHNVLHALGFDAFGLPAEHFAVTTGTHPRTTTERAITTMRGQLQRLGLGHDDRRSVTTIDPGYYRWTQWIFLQLFDSWYDEARGTARPIRELVADLESGARNVPNSEPSWDELDPFERAEVLNSFRLAYVSDSPVNWCPGLGTVLANEEVTSEGRSERGNFPVYQSKLRQWNMRITAYADRLLDDLGQLDWPESIKLQQRNWIGRSSGALITFLASGQPIQVYTTRPDTLFGVTYLVLAPEHPLIETVVAASWPGATEPTWTQGYASPRQAVAAYRARAAARSERERQIDNKDKTGVFTGTFATNPANGDALPIFVADYVLSGYGTGAIMAVPAHDQRDFEFARALHLPIRNVLRPEAALPDEASTWERAFTPEVGFLVNSSNETVTLDGLGVHAATERITAWLQTHGAGKAAASYKLRDWLFSRQRYWGEPFPVVYDDDGVAHALPESMLPLELPEIEDYSPRTFDPEDEDTTPEAPLSRNEEWVSVMLDLGQGPRRYRRETNTMPNWAGSCWYAYRYLDPTNERSMVDPRIESYWMGPREGMPAGGVDLYVGGAEHAVLHLLYARFWSKVLFDLGHVSSSEPFHKLYNQGMIQAFTYRDSRGIAVSADEVEEHDGSFSYRGAPVTRTLGKMGKSLKNSVAPDDIIAQYGADTLRLYEMAMGPLDVSRPWDSRAVIGQYRLLQKIWRNLVDEATGTIVVADVELDHATYRLLHRTIDMVTADMANLRFNTAIAKITELNNHLTKTGGPVPRSLAEAMVLMLAPLAPHIAEELWHRLGHTSTIARAAFPVADATAQHGAPVSCVLQVNGKVRAVIDVDDDVTEEDLKSLALSNRRIQQSIADRDVQRLIVRPPNLVNVVIRKERSDDTQPPPRSGRG